MTRPQVDNSALADLIRLWGQQLGFQQVGITDTDLEVAGGLLRAWIASGRHGEMDYMVRHGNKRGRPAELVPGTLRVVSVRMDYLPEPHEGIEKQLQAPAVAFVSRYTLGRDYHKVLRRRLQRLANRIRRKIGDFGYRVFVDSAPVLEKPLAQKAGLGWIGKHTNLINSRTGSWFFLGELYTDLPLPVDEPARDHCGTCRACMIACPTGAIVAPYLLDARLCISYLTIELKGRIPVRLRPLLGNRIFGCDDCQLACPWNRFARLTEEPDFLPREGLDHSALMELFGWSEEEFLRRTAGTAIRRIGYLAWLRNLAIALGNAPPSPPVRQALQARLDHPSELVREHVCWALAHQQRRAAARNDPARPC